MMRRTAVLIVVTGVALAGCIGAIPRAEFEAELQSRGGGLDQSLVLDAIAAVAAHLDAPTFDVTQVVATPSAGAVVIRARNPHRPHELDRYTVRNGALESVQPEQVSQDDDLETQTFPVADVALEELNAMVDAALQRYDTEGGHVTSLVILLLPSSEGTGTLTPVVQMSLESPRSSATARFSASGSLMTFELR